MIDVHNFLSFQIHGSAGGHKNSDGVAGAVEGLLTFLEGLVGLSPTEIFSTILPGVSGMANIHPLLVHFPIAFLMGFFLLDLCGSLFNKDSWRELAGGLLYLGFIAAGAAVIAGLIAEASVEHGENVHLILKKHKFFGISVFCLSTVLALWRILNGWAMKGVQNVVYLLFAFLLTILIILGVDLGGLMVYKHGVAVDAVKVTSMDYFHEHTHSH